MKKFKIPLFIMAFCVALAASFAFSLPKQDEKKFTVYYYEADGADFPTMSDPDNWEATAPHGNCSITTGTVPCAVTCDGDLRTYLESQLTSAGILAVSEYQRTP